MLALVYFDMFWPHVFRFKVTLITMYITRLNSKEFYKINQLTKMYFCAA